MAHPYRDPGPGEHLKMSNVVRQEGKEEGMRQRRCKKIRYLSSFF